MLRAPLLRRLWCRGTTSPTAATTVNLPRHPSCRPIVEAESPSRAHSEVLQLLLSVTLLLKWTNNRDGEHHGASGYAKRLVLSHRDAGALSRVRTGFYTKVKLMLAQLRMVRQLLPCLSGSINSTNSPKGSYQQRPRYGKARPVGIPCSIIRRSHRCFEAV